MYDINHLPQVIEIGRNGENLFREITFDLKPWLDILPDGVASIVLIRPGETSADSYIATTEFADGILTWNPSLADLGQVEGYGQMEIWLEEEISAGTYKRGKSAKVQTYVQGTIGPADADPPEPQESWMEQMTGLKTATVAAKEAAETAQTGAETAESNSEAWAVGQRDGTDVESTDPTYHNNSKYFAGQAGNSATNAANAKGAAETAQGKAEDAQRDAEAAQAAAEAAMARYPYVDVSTGNWMVYNPATRAWVNTGVHAKGDTGEVPDIQVGTVTTLLPGEQATVTRRSGSPDETPVFDFGIPKGDTGQAENIYGNTIDMSESDSTKVSAAIGAKADKVSSATSGNFAGLDNNGNLVDSGHKHSDYLTAHQDISGKADKVTSATNGNFAALDANGNLTDSGHKHSDYLTSHQDISGKQDKTDSNLTTTAQTVVGAINEHETDLIAVNAAIEDIEDGIAYRLGNTNTTGATLAVGTYVYITGNTNSVADGMYKVTTAIAANGSITTSNVTAVSGGIGNELNSKLSIYLTNATDVVNAYNMLDANKASCVSLSSSFMQSLGFSLASTKGTALKLSTYLDCEVVDGTGNYYTLRFIGSTGVLDSSSSLNNNIPQIFPAGYHLTASIESATRMQFFIRASINTFSNGDMRLNFNGSSATFERYDGSTNNWVTIKQW